MKHKVSGKQDEKYFWMKHPHFFEFRRKMKVTIYCSFDFSTFPFDSHECNLSYGLVNFSKYYMDMMPSTVMHKKKETKFCSCLNRAFLYFGSVAYYPILSFVMILCDD